MKPAFSKPTSPSHCGRRPKNTKTGDDKIAKYFCMIGDDLGRKGQGFKGMLG
jgi:hypothetical protein